MSRARDLANYSALATDAEVAAIAATLGGATGAGGDKVFYENNLTVTTSYTIPATKNAGTFGPVTIANGATVTVSSGAVWTVI